MNSLAEKGRGAFRGIKLLLCENPLPPIDEAIAAAQAEIPFGNYYTEAFSAPLRQLLSEQLGVPERLIHINAGSELILRQLFDRFGEQVHLTALLSLLDDRLVVGDLGCGTGQMSESLAPHVARVVAVDGSADMLQAARTRLQAHGNVDLRQGALEALPLADAELDAAVVSLVLHHQPEPGLVVSEAARVLRPGGRLLIVDMLPHDRTEYQQQMGHVWLGFSEETVRRYLTTAGFTSVRFQVLPADPDAQGPALFVATGRNHDG